MEIKRKVLKQGNSLIVTLPFREVELLKIKKGDLLTIEIKKVSKK